MDELDVRSSPTTDKSDFKADHDDCQEADDFEARLAALDLAREETLRLMLRNLNSRLYFGTPADSSARISDGRGPFSKAPPCAELEWRPLNCHLRAVGHLLLEQERNPITGAITFPEQRASREGIACPDCALFDDLTKAFKNQGHTG